MTKSLLNLYMQKVSQGDESYVAKLITQLADRLVYVPITQRSSDADASALKVNVVKLKEAHRSLVPVFTSEKLMADWCAKQGSGDESISLLSADLCQALGPDSWVWVNPGSESPVELQPFMVEKLRNVGAQAHELVEEESSTVEDQLDDPAAVEAIVELKEVIVEEPAPPPPPKEKRSFLSFLKVR